MPGNNTAIYIFTSKRFHINVCVKVYATAFLLIILITFRSPCHTVKLENTSTILRQVLAPLPNRSDIERIQQENERLFQENEQLKRVREKSKLKANMDVHLDTL